MVQLYKKTTLGELKDPVVCDIDIHDGESSFLYVEGDVYYAICENTDNEGSKLSMEWIIETYPNHVVILYDIKYLQHYIEFDHVVDKMKELRKAYLRDNKLNDILK